MSDKVNHDFTCHHPHANHKRSAEGRKHAPPGIIRSHRACTNCTNCSASSFIHLHHCKPPINLTFSPPATLASNSLRPTSPNRVHLPLFSESACLFLLDADPLHALDRATQFAYRHYVEILIAVSMGFFIGIIREENLNLSARTAAQQWPSHAPMVSHNTTTTTANHARTHK